MGTGSQGAGRGEPSDGAEMRQIDALNRLGPVTRPQPGPPAGGDCARQRDTLLLETGATLAGSDVLAETLRTVTRLHAPDFPLDGLIVFGVTRTFLGILGQHGFRRDGDEDVFRIPVSARFPAAEAFRTGRPVFLHSVHEFREHYPATWPLAQRYGRSAWAFLPLVVSGRITGVCLFAFAGPVGFTGQERTLLQVAARLVAQALERSRISAAEAALARVLRRSMNANAPQPPGLSVATRYVPTGGGLVVGGDWYDVINLTGGRLALVIGDVQGHDTHAASLMARLRTAVHAYAAEGHGPDAVLARASRYLSALDEDRFATCLYIEAEPRNGVLHIARAGHPHPVLRLPDGTCVIKHVPGGLPLGLMPDGHDYPVSDVRLHPGEILLLCTDGLIETGGHDMFSGWVRVRDALTPATDDLEDIADNLLRAVRSPAGDEPEADEGVRRPDEDAAPAPDEGTGAASGGGSQAAGSGGSNGSGSNGASGSNPGSEGGASGSNPGSEGGASGSNPGSEGEGSGNPGGSGGGTALRSRDNRTGHGDGADDGTRHDDDTTGADGARAGGEGGRASGDARSGGAASRAVRGGMPANSRSALAGRPSMAPRNEDDIALMLLRCDDIGERRELPVRRLMLTIGQDQAEGLTEARAELTALLHDWAQPDQVDTAVLLASELLGNVLVHTDQTAALSASVSGEPGHRVLRVEVTDRGDELPHQRAPGELASSGRGLMMLDILAKDWSVRPESEGKTVWFRLAEDQAPPEEALTA